jgi:hypothetical protein
MSRRGLALLVAAGGLTEIVYLVCFVFPYSLIEYFDVPMLDLGKISEFGRSGCLAYLAGMAALFVFYVVAYQQVKPAGQNRHVLAVVLGFTALFGVTLIWVYPIGALDLFGYVFQGKALAVYQANPYAVAPIDFPQDPLYPYLAWVEETSNYGPVWVVFSGLAGMVYGSSLLGGLILLKVVALVFLLITTFVTYLLLKRVSPGAALAGMLFVGWNPLVTTETVASGHNDIVMACFAVLGLYLLSRQKSHLALPALMVSVLVKFVTLVLFPAFLLSWLREQKWSSRSIRMIIIGLLGAGLLAVLFYWPFWLGPMTIGALRRGDLFTASGPALLYCALQEVGYTNASQLTKLLVYSVFIVFVIWRTLSLRSGVSALAEACFDILFVYLTVATLWFQPWYLVVLVPFAAIARDYRRHMLAVIFTASVILNYFVFDFLWYWYPDWFTTISIQGVAVLLNIGPAAVYLLIQAAQALRLPFENSIQGRS